MVFFFGGGWINGNIKQFRPQAEYFSHRGMFCILVDYRVKKRQQSTPFESLKDAKSAIRFIRKHAEEFQVDTSKITASGGSAGGHLAAATALIKDYNEASDDLTLSCVPNALVLFDRAAVHRAHGKDQPEVRELERLQRGVQGACARYTPVTRWRRRKRNWDASTRSGGRNTPV